VWGGLLVEHTRALSARHLRKKRVRERLIPVEQAPGKPFNFGRFEISEEAWPLRSIRSVRSVRFLVRMLLRERLVLTRKDS